MSEQKVLKTGYLWKQGGSYKSWKKRYFVLRGSSLEYYKSEGDGSPKGSIDLTTGRGVRTREQCDLEWPDKAKPGRSFGVAVENRTFYMYGEDPAAVEDWMSTIRRIISKIGKPTSDLHGDVSSTGEAKLSRVLRSTAKTIKKTFSKEKDEESSSCNQGCATDTGPKVNEVSAGSHTKGDEDSGSDCSFVEEVYDDILVANSGVRGNGTNCASGDRAEGGLEIEEFYEVPITTQTANISHTLEELSESSSSEVEEIYEET